MIPHEKYFEGVVHEEGGYPVISVEYSEPNFEYASNRCLNELLKGLITSN